MPGYHHMVRRGQYAGVLILTRMDGCQAATRNGLALFRKTPTGRARSREQAFIEGRYSRRDSMNKPIKENWTAGDISGFGFAFTLVLLATIVSAYSDHPAFWLLVGTGPLVIGVTFIAFLRHLFSVRRGLTAQGRNLRTAGLGRLNVLYRNGTNQ
jgi:hypothetical protein